MQVSEPDPLTLFFSGIKNKVTRDRYERRLVNFLEKASLEGSSPKQKARSFVKIGKENPSAAENIVMKYLLYQRARVEKGEISASTLPNYWKPIKLLCIMTDISLNWTKMTKGMPRGRSYGRDRAPEKEELRKLMNYPDRRIKPIVLLMSSSGIRLGAWDYLKWEHIKPIYQDNKLVAASIVVYAGEPEQYETFITPEAYEAVKEWMDFRASHGETISKDTWVMRNLWDSTSSNHKGLASAPHKLAPSAIKRILERALWAEELRTPLEKGQKRHELMPTHCFRKYFKTTTEGHVPSLYIESFLGHDIGLAASYMKPNRRQFLENYLRLVPHLSISGNASNVKPEHVNELEQRVVVLENLLEKIGVNALLKRSQELVFSGKELEAQEMQDLREQATALKQRAQRAKK
ncbi:MAG: hypothetical protein FJ358_01495 [Thaumarchaeota archaeon]|nr:hypothetical protein [Nitrososphaerota archaeon]